MNIVMNVPKPERVRADSLQVGDAFVSGGTLFVRVDSNSANLKVRTTRKGFLPAVLVSNLNFNSLGWLKRDRMVTPVELEVIVTLKEGELA